MYIWVILSSESCKYVVYELIDISAENAQQEARKRTKRPKKPLSIKPKDIKRAIPKDLEFNRLLGNVTIPLSNQRLKHTKRMNL